MSVYYASPTGLSTNDGSFGSPWDLHTALNNASHGAGDITYVRGGTIPGKLVASLNGGIVMPYCFALPGGWLANPTERVKIDGNRTTTLNGAINSSQTTFALADASGVIEYPGAANEIWIDDEIIHTFGKAGNNITLSVRNYEGTVGGAAAHANGATVRIVANFQIYVSGNNTTYFGFEIMSSLPNRTVIMGKQRGAGIHDVGDGNSFINNIYHDNTMGIFTGSDTSNTLHYGNLMFNNGMQNMAPYPSDQIRGGNMYLENASGYARVYENLILNGFGFNGQFFGATGAFEGGDLRGSVFANAGGPVENLNTDLFQNLYIGTNTQQIARCDVDEIYCWSQDSNQNPNVTFGYVAGIANCFVTNSVFVGSLSGVRFEPVVGTFTGNIIDVNRGGTSRHFVSPGTINTIDNNLYYHINGGTGSGWFYYGGPGHTAVDFANWKIDSGYDANTTVSPNAMPDTVFVRPNEYDIGRAHIIVFAASEPASINVDLATTGLVHNQEYEIRNAFDFFGPEVLTGVYDENDTVISLPLDDVAQNVATPTGLVYTAATTAPAFAAFVVLPGIADVSAPGNPSNLQVNATVRRGATGTMVITWDLADGTDTSVVLTRVVNGTPTEIVLASGTESYTDTGLTIGVTYTYYVRAVNAAGGSENTAPVIRTLTGLSSFGAPPAIAN